MYCSSCGSAVTANSSFCNRCGSALGGADQSSSKRILASVDSLVWAIASVTIVGLGAVIGLMAVMKEVLHFSDTLIAVFSLLFFLSFLGVDAVFVWLLVKLKSGPKEIGFRAKQKAPATTDLDEGPPRSLPQPVMSVTERTTRTLETAHQERKAD